MTDGTQKQTTIKPDHFKTAAAKKRSKTHILYRIFSKRGLLLYIGMTNDLESRIKNHQCTKPWWGYVDRITVQKFESRSQLVEAEAAAILVEKPLCNKIQPLGWQAAKTNSRILPGYGQSLSQANIFCTRQHPDDHEPLIDMTLEQMLYPCVKCSARAIYCEGDTVACKLCLSDWPYDEWFAITFEGLPPDTPPGTQLPLL